MSQRLQKRVRCDRCGKRSIQAHAVDDGTTRCFACWDDEEQLRRAADVAPWRRTEPRGPRTSSHKPNKRGDVMGYNMGPEPRRVPALLDSRAASRLTPRRRGPMGCKCRACMREKGGA